MLEEFEFSGGLKFPLDSKGNISYYFPASLRDKCFENDHIVSWSCGFENQTIISLAILNAYKLKYGDSKKYYSISVRNQQNIGNLFGYDVRFSNRHGFNIEYPSPIVIGNNITYINTSYKYSSKGIEQRASTFKEVWRNSLLPWNNGYKIKLKTYSKNIIDVFNPKWPTLTFIFDDENDKIKDITSFYWDFNSLKFFLYTLSTKKINVFVFTKFESRIDGLYPNVHSFDIGDKDSIYTAIGLSDYLISSELEFLYGAAVYSNASIIEQRNEVNVSDEFREFGLVNDLIVLDEFVPDSVYEAIFS